jgi:ribosome-associated protein
MDLQKIASFTDYFIICNGTSDRMLEALSKSVLEKARETHNLRGRPEGESSAGWLIVDFGSVIVHLFSPDQRKYYNLEELWKEGKVLVRLQ